MKARFLVAAAVALSALVGCEMGDESPVSQAAPQPAITVAGEPGVVGAWTGDHVTANPAPEPVAEPAPAAEPVPAAVPESEPIHDGWHCNGPAYQCRGAEAEREREDEYNEWVQDQLDWAEEQEYWDRQAEEEAEAEANAPHTCEGSGTYGDYSPEGYVDC